MAQFIGRNTIVAGTLSGVRAGVGRVATEHGDLFGELLAEPGAGAAVRVVIPSEALGVYPVASVDAGELGRSSDGNMLRGVVERRDFVGHLAHITIRLAGGQSVSLDGHADTFRAAPFEPAADVWIAWRACDATVIAA